jgi:hypothetical protein
VNGDYVELAGPVSEVEVVQTLVDLLHPLATQPNSSSYTTLTLDDQNFAFVDFCPGGPWTATVAIGHLADDDTARHAMARHVYQRLRTETSWHLRWTSDVSAEVHEVARRAHAVPAQAGSVAGS